LTRPALEGDLRHFQAAEVLQLLGLACATGRLELARGGERAEILIESGRPVFARTSGPAVRTGEMLVHHGAVSRETLESVLTEQQRAPGVKLGAMMMASGKASREQVALAVSEVWRRILYGLMLWSEGSFHFEPGARLIRDLIEFDLDLDRLILEGLSQANQKPAAAGC